MGTNYYARNLIDFVTSKLDKEEEEFLGIHIGKSSAGWCFALHVYPEKGIHNLNDWIKILEKPTVDIQDEYHRILSLEEMLLQIRDRSWNRRYNPAVEGRSYKQFLEDNYAIEGPNGLLRHKVMAGHCIGHGEGTWDLVVGEFS